MLTAAHTVGTVLQKARRSKQMTQPSWSHSSLKDFEGCNRRYHEVKVLKKYPFVTTEATRYGNSVHEALEHYIRDGRPIPPEFSQFKEVVDVLLAKPGRKMAEQKMALTNDLQPCEWFDKKTWVRGIADMLIVDDDKRTARVVDWKGLALDTKLPTPTGYTTMGEVQVGDTLFSESGDQCHVVGKSEVKNIRCYKVLFDDTTEVVCDENHLWKLTGGQVVPSIELRGAKDREIRPSGCAHIAVASPLALADVNLPIDPYVLGLWLADGKHTSGEISKPDTFIWEEIQRRGYKVNMDTGGKKSCPTRTVLTLSAALKALGLLGNKHIPMQYLRAGYSQRLALLQGIMDGDGNANPTRKQAVLTTVTESFAVAVCDLLSGLGQRPLLSRVNGFGFGKAVKVFPVSFRPVGINPFLMPRKRDRILASWGTGNSAYRAVVSVTEIPSTPTQCISVDSSDHTFLCTEKMIPTHNTGNNKYPDRDQLVLMSLMVFAHFPEIDKVHSALLFIVKGSIVKLSMTRDHVEKQWWMYRERTAKIEAAMANNVWNPTQTPLCRFCQVVSCEFNERR